MKEGWEIKKFTDVLWFQEGPGVRNTQYTLSGVKLLNVANLVEGNIDLSTSDRYISEEEAYGKYKHFLVDEGDLIIASSGIQVSYVEKKMGFINKSHLPLCMNTSTIRFKSLDKNILNIKFFMYYLKSNSYKVQLSKYIVGAAQLNYGPSHLKQMKFSIPSISEQAHIVEELDLLNGILDKKRQQLKELDSLSQSIFYNMFGDPEKNEYEFVTKQISSISKIVGGGTPSKSQPQYWEGNIPWITSKDMKTDAIYDSKIHITEMGVNNSSAKLLPVNSVVFVMRSGILKHTFPIAINHVPITINQDLKAILPCKSLNSTYLLFCMKAFSSYLLSNVRAVTADNIELSVIKNLNIPVPPIALQNEFADKIKSIERQKKLIKASIAETQILLDSRMDYYFN